MLSGRLVILLNGRRWQFLSLWWFLQWKWTCCCFVPRSSMLGSKPESLWHDQDDTFQPVSAPYHPRPLYFVSSYGSKLKLFNIIWKLTDKTFYLLTFISYHPKYPLRSKEAPNAGDSIHEFRNDVFNFPEFPNDGGRAGFTVLWTWFCLFTNQKSWIYINLRINSLIFTNSRTTNNE